MMSGSPGPGHPLLLEAVEILHAHHHGTLQNRIFRASRLIFKDCMHSFEMYPQNGGHHEADTDFPVHGEKKNAVFQRIGELVPTQNPIFPLLQKGEKSPVRLSDLISFRQFRRTELYQEVFRFFDVRHQLVLPLHTENHSGGLTVNRDGRDFTDAELASAVIFARHLEIAFATHKLLGRSVLAGEELKKTDFLQLRRMGLTRRECEVLWWISQGKRDGEIAIILGIASRTASHHVENILAKLRVETRTAAAAMALAMFRGQ